MKSESKNGNLHKFIAAAIIGLVFILIVGVAVSGWQNENDGENSGEGGEKTDGADNPDGDTDGDKNGTADNNINEQPEAPPRSPEFTNYLTGLECNENQHGAIPYAFMIDPGANLYGISDSELVVEIPIEDKRTRFMMYRSDIDDLGKIGALVPTRDYISLLTKFFGGILVADGSDDTVDYTTLPSTLHLDISKSSKYTYKENGKYVYTDNGLISAYASDEGIDTQTLKTQALPYKFSEFNESVRGKSSANEIIIPYAETTSFYYNADTHKYALAKNGEAKIDMITGKAAEFRNLFILFADTVTYELSSGTQCVTETSKSGSGYYITEGTLTEIKWYVTESGALIFENLNSEILTVNRGSSYVGYFKSSESSSVVFK